MFDNYLFKKNITDLQQYEMSDDAADRISFYSLQKTYRRNDFDVVPQTAVYIKYNKDMTEDDIDDLYECKQELQKYDNVIFYKQGYLKYQRLFFRIYSNRFFRFIPFMTDKICDVLKERCQSFYQIRRELKNLLHIDKQCSIEDMLKSQLVKYDIKQFNNVLYLRVNLGYTNLGVVQANYIYFSLQFNNVFRYGKVSLAYKKQYTIKKFQDLIKYYYDKAVKMYVMNYRAAPPDLIIRQYIKFPYEYINYLGAPVRNKGVYDEIIYGGYAYSIPDSGIINVQVLKDKLVLHIPKCTLGMIEYIRDVDMIITDKYCYIVDLKKRYILQVYTKFISCYDYDYPHLQMLFKWSIKYLGDYKYRLTNNLINYNNYYKVDNFVYDSLVSILRLPPVFKIYTYHIQLKGFVKRLIDEAAFIVRYKDKQYINKTVV